jgi:disulfide bond formation protein DsbB
MSKNSKIILCVTLFLMISSLLVAYFIEHGLGHKPCKLCLYQRLPYFFSIVLILNILLVRKYEKFSLLILSLTMLLGSSLAFYHYGIEQGFFNESFMCADSNLSKEMTKEEILSQLRENVVSCKEVTFKLLGFSLASINTIFSFVLFCIFIMLYKNYESNR